MVAVRQLDFEHVWYRSASGLATSITTDSGYVVSRIWYYCCRPVQVRGFQQYVGQLIQTAPLSSRWCSGGPIRFSGACCYVTTAMLTTVAGTPERTFTTLSSV